MEVLGLQYDLELLMWMLGVFELAVAFVGAFLWAMAALHVLIECTNRSSRQGHAAEQLKSA